MKTRNILEAKDCTGSLRAAFNKQAIEAIKNSRLTQFIHDNPNLARRATIVCPLCLAKAPDELAYAKKNCAVELLKSALDLRASAKDEDRLSVLHPIIQTHSLVACKLPCSRNERKPPHGILKGRGDIVVGSRFTGVFCNEVERILRYLQKLPRSLWMPEREHHVAKGPLSRRGPKK